MDDKIIRYKTGLNNIKVIEEETDTVSKSLEKKTKKIDNQIKFLQNLLDDSINSLKIISDKLETNYI